MKETVCAENTKSRHPGIETLRIVAMLMICWLHVNICSGALTDVTKSTAYYVASWSGSFCVMAVNLYAMATGYVSVENSWKFKRIIALMVQAWFWIFILDFVFYLLGENDFMGIELLKKMIWTPYWYVNAYVVLFLLIPFLNKLLNALNRKEYSLFAALIVYCTITNRFNISPGYNAGQLIICYMLGGYLKKFPCLIPTCVLLFGVVATGVYTAVSGMMTGVNLLPYTDWRVMISAMLMFAVFLKISHLNGFFSRLVQYVSPLTFGIYLIHCHPCVGKLLYDISHRMLHVEITPVITLPLFATLLFILCAAMERCRLMLFNFIHMKQLVERCSSIIEGCFNRLVKKMGL